MVLSLAGTGSVLTNGTEQELFNITALAHYATWVFLPGAFTTGDAIVIRVYVLDNTGAVLSKYLDVQINGPQSSPAIFIPFVPANQYRVTIQRSAGTDRTYNWSRYQA